MNNAIWESVEHFRNAFSHPKFQTAMAAYPNSAMASPHLSAQVVVSNLCAGASMENG